jgi:hypothetical protein
MACYSLAATNSLGAKCRRQGPGFGRFREVLAPAGYLVEFTVTHCTGLSQSHHFLSNFLLEVVIEQGEAICGDPCDKHPVWRPRQP